jgi:hypothetical protein
LCDSLERYLRGQKKALSVVAVPTEEQEEKRALTPCDLTSFQGASPGAVRFPGLKPWTASYTLLGGNKSPQTSFSSRHNLSL